jgi:predicted amidophosphoribosyltransferase
VLQLARAAARHLRDGGQPVRVLPLLTPTRTPADQSGLDAVRRVANVHSAFVARAGHSTRSDAAVIILVDDIVTTGATASECARTLAAAGWPVSGVAAVAAAVLRRPVRRTSGAEPGTPDEEVQGTPSVVSVGIA